MGGNPFVMFAHSFFYLSNLTKMEKLKTIGCILLFAMSCLTIGAYITHVSYNISVVKPHQWVMTPMFGLFFLFCFIDRIKNK
jgi:hypothetical protein